MATFLQRARSVGAHRLMAIGDGRLGSVLRRTPVSHTFVRLLKRAASGDGIVREGPCKGARFNSFGGSVRYLDGTKELDVQLALAAAIQPGSVVWDVGAAQGFYTVLAARCTGAAGTVFAFEPLPDNQAALRHNVRSNDADNVRIMNLALGESTGVASFALGRERTQGRLASLPGTPASVGTGEIEVQVASVDELLEQGLVSPPSTIKLDIEGAEVEMLRGAAACLRSYRPTIVAEMHGRSEEVFELLEAAEYDYVVLGHDVALARAPWSCHVVATPR